MNRKKLTLFLLWLAFISLPFIYAIFQQTDNLVFGGFLINPIDGYSYLAKMQQGYSGAWSFQLPYSADYNGPAFIFMFYILLGHIARIFNLNVLVTFQITRVVAATLMFFVILKFVDQLQIKNKILDTMLLLVLAFGGGFGWLYLLTGDLPADLWVAEAFPFLSALSNPHFCLSIAIILYVFIMISTKKLEAKEVVILFICSLILALISPFAVAIILMLLFANVFINWKSTRISSLIRLAIFAIGGLPVVAYQFLVVVRDPVLMGWNVQNITPAPTLLNFIFSFSPYLPGIFVLLFLISKKGKIQFTNTEILLMVWAVGAVILLYLPLNLQRRFLIAYYIPVVLLFFVLFDHYLHLTNKLNWARVRRLTILILLFSLPSSLLLITGVLGAISSRSEDLFVPRSIVNAGNWLQWNSDPETVILTSLQNGKFIPALSPNKTVYGHPFETINYAETGRQVDVFWSSTDNKIANDLLTLWKVRYVMVGPDRHSGEIPSILKLLPVVYDDGQVTIFKVLDD